jgi:eukaryotic-like serine/threonine-protein kinase
VAAHGIVGERFELRAFVGAGGFGDVWQAVDVRSNDLVAIKFLRRPERIERERFGREAAILQGFDHPAIVPLITYGQGPDRIPFLVMPWLAGETLSSRLARGTLAIDETRTLAIRVAEALDYAHGRGVIHRDLKPANIFLLGGRPEAVRVLDFGLARTTPSPSLTATGLAVGTPGYMAPEQARGERIVDGRVDMYSLGCVLFRCLIGRDVFHGSPGMIALLRAAHESPPRVRPIRPDVPLYLDELIDALLSRDRDHRPTAGAALEVLAKRGGAPPSIHPTSIAPMQWHGFAVLRPMPSATLEELDEPTFRDREQRVDRIVSSEGARLEVLLDGSMLLFPNPLLAPIDQVRSLARCCLRLRDVLRGTGLAIVGDPTEGAAHTSSLLDAGAALLGTLDRPVIVVDRPCAIALEPFFDLAPAPAGALLVGVRLERTPIAGAPVSRTAPDLVAPELSPTLSEQRAIRWSWLSFIAGIVAGMLVCAAVAAAFFI